ncbi:MAG: metal ABC transporter ATP-binding protein [Anaerolineales bacterium]|nr:metal ABC transporter ATP-binding protein [Anaerolineales bacterium]
MGLLEELRKTNHYIGHHHPHEPGVPILRADNLSVRYDSGFALEDITFELKTGERLSVVGPNGAGKSTLFKVIAGVLKPSEGQVHVFGSAPDGHICIAYVPQRSQVDWDFPVCVQDVVMMGRIGKLGLFRHPKANDWEIVSQALELVGMSSLAKRQISQLSGGQQQRMFIARALAQEAELMLMDEPLTGLDVNSQEDIFNILEALKDRNVTMMVAMHDLKMASLRFERVMLLNHRLYGLGTPGEVFYPENLVQAYGGHLHVVPTESGLLALGDTCCDEGGDYP